MLEYFRASSCIVSSVTKKIDGRKVKIDEAVELEKFSSMGNAYTFELESLLFWSVAMCCCEHLSVETGSVCVYGDDIVIPVEAYDLLVEVLTHLGLLVNSKKSYKEGPFRESCGADYYRGFDIRPYYLKELISVRTLFSMHNWFMRSCELKLALCVLQFIPEHLRLFGPDGYGDGHLIGHAFKLSRSKKLKERGLEGGVFDTYQLKKRTFTGRFRGDYVYPCYSIYVNPSVQLIGIELLSDLDDVESDGDTVRGWRGYQKISIYTHATRIFHRDRGRTQPDWQVD